MTLVRWSSRILVWSYVQRCKTYFNTNNDKQTSVLVIFDKERSGVLAGDRTRRCLFALGLPRTEALSSSSISSSPRADLKRDADLARCRLCPDGEKWSVTFFQTISSCAGDASPEAVGRNLRRA